MITIDDGSVQIHIARTSVNALQLNIRTGFNLVYLFQKVKFSITLSNQEFAQFQQALQAGVKAVIGHKSFWQTHTITVLQKNHPNQYRDIRLYKRSFMVAVLVVPVTLSQVVVKGILEATL